VRIALLTDVHANLEALLACLEHADRAGASRCVFLGDLVGYGADPVAVLEIVRGLVERGGAAVLGNHDAAALRGPDPRMNAEARAAIAWTHSRLTPAALAFLASLPLSREEDERLYVHANAWAPERWEYVTSAFEAGRSMRATRSRLTFCGHMHTPALYHLGADGRTGAFEPTPGAAIRLSPLRRWLAIPGSVGQSRDGNPAAAYALLDDATAAVTFQRVPYDVEAATRKIREAGLPLSFNARPEAWLGSR
jgi:diadenosine tetraphosphatase ApaH/serine/threonine PP2A family protein phosphatase